MASMRVCWGNSRKRWSNNQRYPDSVKAAGGGNLALRKVLEFVASPGFGERPGVNLKRPGGARLLVQLPVNFRQVVWLDDAIHSPLAVKGSMVEPGIYEPTYLNYCVDSV